MFLALEVGAILEDHIPLNYSVEKTCKTGTTREITTARAQVGIGSGMTSQAVRALKVMFRDASST